MSVSSLAMPPAVSAAMPSAVPRAMPPVGRRTGIALAVLYPVFGLACLALYFLSGRQMALYLIVAPPVAVLFYARPMVPAVLLLVLWGTVLPPKVARIGLGPIKVPLGEMVMLIALGTIVARFLMSGMPKQGFRFTGPVLAFVGACFFGALVGVHNGESVHDAQETLRILLTFLSFFVFRSAFRGATARFEIWLVSICALACAMVIVGVVTGLPTTGRVVDHLITGGQLSNLERVDPAALRLVSIVLVMMLCGVVRQRKRWLVGVALGLMLFVEVLSYTRSTWVPLILIGLVAPAVVSARRTWLVVTERIIVLAIIGTALLFLAAHGRLGSSAEQAYRRLASTVNSSTLRDSSLNDRTQNELANALPAIRHHPITGVGLNLPYGAVNVDYDPATDQLVYSPRQFTHNTPVGVWLWLGLPGVLALIWLVSRYAAQVVRLFRRFPRAALAGPFGAACGLVVLSVQSTFQTNLFYQPALMAFAVAFAYLDVWLDEHARESAASLGPGPVPAGRRSVATMTASGTALDEALELKSVDITPRV